jgi:mannose-6-phosphate isomerase-like protein (cupin superfamily)
MTHELLEKMNLGIVKEDLHIDQILFSPYSYQQEFIKIIMSPDICINALNIIEVMGHVGKTIKIEAMERLSKPLHQLCHYVANKLNHDGPVTCHLFLAYSGSESFPEHADPDNVLIYVVDGEKTMKLGNELITIMPGQALFIPYNTMHQAINNKDSIILSFGLERYTLEKL